MGGKNKYPVWFWNANKCRETMMNLFYNRVAWAACLLLIFGISTTLALADDHEDKHEKHEKHEIKNDDDENHGIKPVGNPNYATECGACHFAYPPELLPSESWRKIVAGLEDHFGENVAIDTGLKNEIIQYLSSNGADVSSAEVSVKIMKSIDGQTPNRITELPYIIKKHRDVAPSIFKRVTIGSLSNCAACHKTADKGDFDDDGVVIPK